MEQVFASTAVEADVAAKLLERFQQAETLLRTGGSAAAAEVTEAATASGWIRVGSGDPNLEINPFAAVLLGFEPPLLSGTMAPLPVVKEKDVPSGPGDVFS